MALVIAIVNQKGGCGKTTTSINLSAALSKHKRVLLIDLDPQSHSTIGLNVNPNSLKRSIFDVLDLRESKMSFKDIVLEIGENFYLAPTNLYLTSLEQKLSGKKDRENRLKEELKEIDLDYDYVLIDCPPNFGLLTVNALLAASHLIVPVETSTFSLEGLKRIQEVAGMLERKVGHQLEIKYLVSIYDRRTSFARNFTDNLEKDYEDQVFRTKIHRSINFNEAAQAGKPVSFFRPGSIGCEDFNSLTKEVLAWAKEVAPKISPIASTVTKNISKTNEVISPVEIKEKATVYSGAEFKNSATLITPLQGSSKNLSMQMEEEKSFKSFVM